MLSTRPTRNSAQKYQTNNRKVNDRYRRRDGDVNAVSMKSEDTKNRSEIDLVVVGFSKGLRVRWQRVVAERGSAVDEFMHIDLGLRC